MRNDRSEKVHDCPVGRSHRLPPNQQLVVRMISLSKPKTIWTISQN
jgi:DNA-binding helix-hairpin-helix protein with protein kinase domain